MKDKLIQELTDILNGNKYEEETLFYTPCRTDNYKRYSTSAQSTGEQLRIKRKIFKINEEKLKLIITFLKLEQN